MCSQSPPDGTGLLWAKVEWHVLLALVEQAELVALLEIDDSKDSGNGLADVMTARDRKRSVSICVYGVDWGI